jgi:Shikimate kinase
MNKKNRASIKEQGTSVWLNADLETLWKRVRYKKTRPLLQTNNPKETLASIYTDRIKTYALADIIIESHAKSSLEEMAKLVIKSLLDRNDLIERA